MLMNGKAGGCKVCKYPFMSIIGDKGFIALLGRTGTGSLLFYEEDAK